MKDRRNSKESRKDNKSTKTINDKRRNHKSRDRDDSDHVKGLASLKEETLIDILGKREEDVYDMKKTRSTKKESRIENHSSLSKTKKVFNVVIKKDVKNNNKIIVELTTDNTEYDTECHNVPDALRVSYHDNKEKKNNLSIAHERTTNDYAHKYHHKDNHVNHDKKKKEPRDKRSGKEVTIEHRSDVKQDINSKSRKHKTIRPVKQTSTDNLDRKTQRNRVGKRDRSISSDRSNTDEIEELLERIERTKAQIKKTDKAEHTDDKKSGNRYYVQKNVKDASLNRDVNSKTKQNNRKDQNPEVKKHRRCELGMLNELYREQNVPKVKQTCQEVDKIKSKSIYQSVEKGRVKRPPLQYHIKSHDTKIRSLYVDDNSSDFGFYDGSDNNIKLDDLHNVSRSNKRNKVSRDKRKYSAKQSNRHRRQKYRKRYSSSSDSDSDYSTTDSESFDETTIDSTLCVSSTDVNSLTTMSDNNRRDNKRNKGKRIYLNHNNSNTHKDTHRVPIKKVQSKHEINKSNNDVPFYLRPFSFFF